jgi:hypothetical protein
MVVIYREKVIRRHPKPLIEDEEFQTKRVDTRKGFFGQERRD